MKKTEPPPPRGEASPPPQHKQDRLPVLTLSPAGILSLALPGMVGLILGQWLAIPWPTLRPPAAVLAGMEILLACVVLITGHRAYRSQQRWQPWLLGSALLLLSLTDALWLKTQDYGLWTAAQTTGDIAAIHLGAAFLAVLAAQFQHPMGAPRTSVLLLPVALLVALAIYLAGPLWTHWLWEIRGQDAAFRIAGFALAAGLYALAAISLRGSLQTSLVQTRQVLMALASLALASLCQMASQETTLLILVAQGYRLLAYALIWRFLSSAAGSVARPDPATLDTEDMVSRRITAMAELLSPVPNGPAWVMRCDDGQEALTTPLIETHAGAGRSTPALEPLLTSSDLNCLVEMAEISTDLIAFVTAEGRLRYLNSGGRAMLGIGATEDISKLMIDQVFPYRRQDLRQLATIGSNMKAWRGETKLQQAKSERKIPVIETELTWENGDANWLLVARDLSELEEHRKELWLAANSDPLTGLPNRRFLEERLATEFAVADKEGKRLALACLSIGRFKDVSDAFGQSAGDSLLRELATRIRASIPAPCTVARMGGAEFAVIVPQVAGTEEADTIGRKLQLAVTRPLHLGSSEFRFTCSIGFAIFPMDANGPQHLITAADIALHRAKRKGVTHWEYYTQQMDREVREQVLLEAHLRQALAKDELCLEFQPQVRLSDGMIVGVEALIRWRHPQFGTVQPDRFIPIAEASGLIVPIGEWVLRSATLQQVAWARAGYAPLRMGINVSTRQFHEADLVAQVENAITYSGIAPKHIELEITESVLMEDSALADTVLRKLSAMGVSIAIDDFGTGYSSLAYVKAFPIDRLKIDRCFIQELPGDASGSVITQSILSLAKGLGLKTVAEGVENPEQMEFLKTHGCDELQGYLLSRPLPPTQLEELLDQQHLHLLP